MQNKVVVAWVEISRDYARACLRPRREYVGGKVERTENNPSSNPGNTAFLGWDTDRRVEITKMRILLQRLFPAAAVLPSM